MQKGVVYNVKSGVFYIGLFTEKLFRQLKAKSAIHYLQPGFFHIRLLTEYLVKQI
jgi:hypothetical protein